ncbi:plastocyanin/azurin family copper-binding protein [Alkalimarinus coralli]|uniref:plastocyanin/azurin family copper-binding protein n=1 Tax=Alkalimarinus coralli TaxID=2935863 RepID=UPI00202B5504|nr:plastocyanin/azurin family copper-binding protein [Alkalimarinus coralli]
MFNKVILAFMALIISFTVNAGDVADVSIKKFEFIPKEITVKKGTKIRWTNNEKRQYHSVWFEERGDPEPDYFFPEETFELEFNEVGTFPYRCGPHPEMLGTVIVTE